MSIFTNKNEKMTPAEKKANEIYERFRNVEYLQDVEGMDYELAKQTSLICVDELITSFTNTCCESYNVRFWQEVKQQINNLHP